MTECYDAGKEKLTFALVTGSLYIVTGILQALTGAGLFSLPLLPGSIMGAFVLIVIGSVFIFGHRELAESNPEGQAFIVVGILLSIIFGILYLLVLSADMLSAYVLESDDFSDWTIMDDLRPELYLSLLAVWGYLKWKDEFSMEEAIPLDGGKKPSSPETEEESS
jgi:hypothetical protein